MRCETDPANMRVSIFDHKPESPNFSPGRYQKLNMRVTRIKLKVSLNKETREEEILAGFGLTSIQCRPSCREFVFNPQAVHQLLEHLCNPRHCSRRKILGDNTVGFEGFVELILGAASLGVSIGDRLPDGGKFEISHVVNPIVQPAQCAGSSSWQDLGTRVNSLI